MTAHTHTRATDTDTDTDTDTETSYWESLAASYKMPVNVLRDCYSKWNPRVHQRFSDYIQIIREEQQNANTK